jgi:two-component sensor histidine kinase
LLDVDRAEMQQYGAKSILYIPIHVKGELVGYAELWDSRQRREFAAEEIALCHDMTRQAAAALENAQLYEQAQKEIGERKQAEEEIRASLQEKEVLLKEIHHRVKNNLQVISSLLNLQSAKAEEPVAIAVLTESKDRVRAMSLIHEKLYQSSNLSRLDFGEYIDDLAGSLLRSNEVALATISPRIETEAVPLDLDAAIPCGLIVNELVTNALKHAFPNDAQGEVWIELKRDNGSVRLTVGDDGVGLPDGWDIQSSESLGMRLVTALVGQLDGNLTLNREGGTEFVITFGIGNQETEA